MCACLLLWQSRNHLSWSWEICFFVVPRVGDFLIAIRFGWPAIYKMKTNSQIRASPIGQLTQKSSRTISTKPFPTRPSVNLPNLNQMVKPRLDWIWSNGNTLPHATVLQCVHGTTSIVCHTFSPWYEDVSKKPFRHLTGRHVDLV